LDAEFVTQDCTSEVSAAPVQSKKPLVVGMVVDALAVALN
jgi:hypothetical protein